MAEDTLENLFEDEKVNDDKAEDTKDAKGAEDADAKGAEDAKSAEDAKGTEDAKDADDGEGGKDKEPMIPKSRLDAKSRMLNEERQKRQELEAKFDEQNAQKPTNAQKLAEAIVAYDKKIAEAEKDGDTDAMIKLLKEQRRFERAFMTNAVQDSAQETARIAVEQVRLDSVITALEEKYPFVNPDDESYDKEFVDEVMDLYEAAVAKGTAASTAMMKAFKYAHAARVSEADDAGAGQARGGKPKLDVAKNLDAAKRAAPSLKSAGMDGNAAGMKRDIDPAKLTEEEFAALPASTLARLRGDLV